MGQHNLGTVVSFEFLRTISKKRFWAGTLAVPVIMAVIFVLIYISNSSTASAADAQENAQFSISYTDASGLITPEQAGLFKATQAGSPEQGVEAVRAGTVDAFFEFPADPASNEV